jgi:outer membrane protein OmpA-like peptidoglycan-associated protein
MVNVTLQGIVMDDATNEPIAANIIVRSITTGDTFESTSNANDGKYSLVLSAGNQYSIQFSNDFHVSEIFDLDLRTQDKYTEMEKEIRMKTDYKLEIVVKDKDFLNNISSFLQVVDQNGKALLNDSIHAAQYPYSITLTAGRNYSIVASANRHASSTLAWQFDALKTSKQNTQIISLEHLKTELFADVVGITTNQRIKAKVFFNNENSDEVVIIDAGETVTLRKGDRYQVTTSSDAGYLFNNTTIVAGEQGELSETGQRSLTLKAVPIEAGAQLTLEHISFAINSSDLNPSSYPTLNRVAELLKTNPNVSVEISAHTDDLGDDVYNLRLSERRALSIVRYLNKNGVEIQRMRPQGHGKQKPLVPNVSEENRARNRRVELQILRAK